MERSTERWWRTPAVWVEVFVLLNLAVLAGDIYIAHSVNEFRRAAEYAPLYFSLIAPVVLLVGLIFRARGPEIVWRELGYLVGWSSILIGLTGVILHLNSHFFYERTIRSLTYAAPFAAPLAYAGLGFLLVMNRMIAQETLEWSRWVLLLTMGGFFGNFILCLTDHAENGFFRVEEWIPIISSAFAVGFLVIPLVTRAKKPFLELTAFVLLAQAVVGIVGFYFHLEMNLRGPSGRLWHDLVYGAPPLAPMLFPNLVLLGYIGLWTYAVHVPEGEWWVVTLWRARGLRWRRAAEETP